MGTAPSHPELLDWLAAEFVANGWRLKPLHRLIVLSNAYQMSAGAEKGTGPLNSRGSVPFSAPADGSLLARWLQRRMEAEAVCESSLAVSRHLEPDERRPSKSPTLPASGVRVEFWP